MTSLESGGDLSFEWRSAGEVGVGGSMIFPETGLKRSRSGRALILTTSNVRRAELCGLVSLVRSTWIMTMTSIPFVGVG